MTFFHFPFLLGSIKLLSFCLFSDPILFYSVVQDGGSGGGEEAVCHERRPGVSEALLRGGEPPQAVLREQGASQGTGQHQAKRVSQSAYCTVTVR